MTVEFGWQQIFQQYVTVSVTVEFGWQLNLPAVCDSERDRSGAAVSLLLRPAMLAERTQ